MCVAPDADPRRVECRILAEDPCFELLQRASRLKPELAAQPAGPPPVCVERVGLAAGTVESKHELLEQVLSKRMLREDRLQLGDELAVPPKLEVGIDPGLERCQLALFESRDLHLRPRLEAQIRERPAAKECKRLAQPLSRLLRRGAGRRADERVEAIDVQLAWRNGELVTATPSDDATLAEGAAEPRDVDLDAFDCGGRRPPAPNLLDQTVRRDRPATREQQQSE